MKGSCLCSAVEYEIDSLHAHHALPLQDVQKGHSAAFATTAGVLREHFRYTKGEDMLTAFESSLGKLRYFCRSCGSHLVAERLGQPHVIVRIASLDEEPGMSPVAHIWTSHDVPWLAYDEVHEFPEWQPGR